MVKNEDCGRSSGKKVKRLGHEHKNMQPIGLNQKLSTIIDRGEASHPPGNGVQFYTVQDRVDGGDRGGLVPMNWTSSLSLSNISNPILSDVVLESPS